MATSIDKADGFTRNLLQQALHEYHPELVKHEVSVGVLMVYDPEDSGARVLKHQGYPAVAVVKINSLEQRAQGMPDATIKIDRAEWDQMPDRRRIAILDHELQHLEIQYDEAGFCKSDDQGRPKLKIRLHDLVVGGFSCVMARHGDDSGETRQLEVVAEVLAQRSLPFMAATPEDADAAFRRDVADMTAQAAQELGADPETVEGLRKVLGPEPDHVTLTHLPGGKSVTTDLAGLKSAHEKFKGRAKDTGDRMDRAAEADRMAGLAADAGLNPETVNAVHDAIAGQFA